MGCQMGRRQQVPQIKVKLFHDLGSDIFPASDDSIHAQCVLYMYRKYQQDMCRGIGKNYKYHTLCQTGSVTG